MKFIRAGSKIQDPRLLRCLSQGAWIQILARMNVIRFHPISFDFIHSGGILDPRLLGKTPQQSWILDLGSRPNEFHSVSFGGGPGYEIHSGRIQDPRSKIDEGSFPVILDPGRARMKPNEIHSGGVLDPRLLGKTQQSWILDLGSRPKEFHSVSFGFIRGRSWIQDCREGPPSNTWILPKRNRMKSTKIHSGWKSFKGFDEKSLIKGRFWGGYHIYIYVYMLPPLGEPTFSCVSAPITPRIDF